MERSRGSVLVRLRWWRQRRRINRTLRDAGWPVDVSFFTGEVLISETTYPPGERAITAIEDTDAFGL